MWNEVLSYHNSVYSDGLCLIHEEWDLLINAKTIYLFSEVDEL